MKVIFKNLPSVVGGTRENSEFIQLKRSKRQSDFLICSFGSSRLSNKKPPYSFEFKRLGHWPLIGRDVLF